MPVEVHPLTLRQTWEAVRTNRPLLVLCASTLVMVPLAPRLSARFGVRPTYVGMAVVAAVGALGIALSLLFGHQSSLSNLPAVMLEVAWIAISIYGIVVARRIRVQ